MLDEAVERDQRLAEAQALATGRERWLSDAQAELARRDATIAEQARGLEFVRFAVIQGQEDPRTRVPMTLPSANLSTSGVTGPPRDLSTRNPHAADRFAFTNIEQIVAR